MKKKRSTSKELGAQVVALRASLGNISQDDLAEKLGVTRGAVSACEIGRTVLAPSALVKLAELAPNDNQKAFFLEQAGLDERMVTRAAEAIFQSHVPAAREGDIVTVNALPGTRSIGDLILPRARVPNPVFTFYASELPSLTWLVLSPGLIVVDTMDAGEVLAPFQGTIVLVKSTLALRGEPEYLVGKVHMALGKFREGAGRPTPPVAVLAGDSVPDRFEGLKIGSHSHSVWEREDVFDRVREAQGSTLEVYLAAHKLALREIRTLPGIEIVGKVIAWFADGGTGHVPEGDLPAAPNGAEQKVVG